MSALEGIRVLDLSRLIPGPYASQLLADQGAQVIKVEQPPDGDYLRGIGPMVDVAANKGRHSTSAIFARLNRGKLSVSLNFDDPDGREALLRLVRTADVFVESFRPGMLGRRGLGYDDLGQVNPRIIYCSLSGYGLEGPYVQRAGHDLNYIALAGILGLNAKGEGVPLPPPVQMADLSGGMRAAMEITAALLERTRTGTGKRIDVALFDSSLEWMDVVLGSVYRGGQRTPSPGATLLTGMYPCYNVYQTADGLFVSLGALEQRFWGGFCQALGRQDLVTSQFDERAVHIVAEIFRSKTREEWISFSQQVDVCLEPLLTIEETMKHPQVKARGLVREDARRIPRLGEDTVEILSEVGYHQVEIEDMLAAGVIGRAG